MHFTPPLNRPTAPPAAPRRRTGLIIAASAAAAALVGVEVTAAIVATRHLTDIAVSSTTTSAAVGDEVEVRAVAYAIEEAINDADYDTFAALVCKQMRADPRFDKSTFLETSVAYREFETGGLFIIIDSIVVTGDTAIGNVMVLARPPFDAQFVREDGGWKWCGDLTRLLSP